MIYDLSIMKISYNISAQEITSMVLQKAKYQQVAICFDSNSDLNLLEELTKSLQKNVVLFSYNLDNFSYLSEIINDGIRCVISLLSFSNFIRLKNLGEFNFFLIDVITDNFISPHIIESSEDSYLFVKSKYENNLSDVMYIFANLVELRFLTLLKARNYGREEEKLIQLMSKFNVEQIETEKLVDFLTEEKFILTNNNLVELSTQEVGFYYYAIILAYKHLFLMFKYDNLKLVDIYKNYQNNFTQVNLSHKLLFDERLIFLLKTNYENMLEYIDLFLNKVNIKLLKINNKIKIYNILKILKNNIKILNKDNLIKLSYLYGVFEAI